MTHFKKSMFILMSFIGMMTACGIAFRYFGIPWSALSWWAGAACAIGWEALVEELSKEKEK